MKPCSVFALLSVLCIASSASSWHPLLKRQDQGGMCSDDRILAKLCNNGFYEDYAYIAAQCSLTAFAGILSDTCRVNENGVICGTLDTSEQFMSACASSLTNVTCSDKCRSFLIDTRVKYGCCVNILNDTFGDSVQFSYPLWSRCGVEPMTKECAPSSFAMPAEIDPTCTEEVFLERVHFRVFCRTEFLDDQRDLGVSCGKNIEDLEYPSLCAVDENGNYCSLSSDINFTACTDTRMCDPLCTETLTNLTSKFGCCFISEFNSTSAGSYFSYEFWERCGLSSPGFCDLKLDNSPSRISTAVALKIPVQAVLLATAMALTLMNNH